MSRQQEDTRDPGAPPVCLTMAGSDSSGGAGLQADLKTMAALGVYGLSVVTAVTAQNTRGVSAVFELPAEAVRAQLEALFDDFTVSAAKTGMLATSAIVRAVAERWRSLTAPPPLVVDPVLASSSGRSLLAPEAIEALRRELLPLATVLTPNRGEAEILSGCAIRERGDLADAGASLLALGPHAVVIKGGHLEGGDFDPALAEDFLFTDGGMRAFPAPRLETRATHGTGCTFSAALCAWLARGLPVAEATGKAKAYLTAAISHGLPLGHGHGPADHFYFLSDRTDGSESPRSRRQPGP